MEFIDTNRLSPYIKSLSKTYSKEIRDKLNEKLGENRLSGPILDIIEECASSGFTDGATMILEIVNEILNKKLEASKK
jgi:hypothetical protein